MRGRPPRPLDGAAERVEVAGLRRDQHRRDRMIEGQRQRVLVQAEQKVGAGRSAGPELILMLAESTLTGKPSRFSSRTASSSCGNGVSGRQPRSMTSAPAARSVSRPRDERVDDRVGASTISAKMRMSCLDRSGRLAGAAEKGRQVGDLVGSAHDRHAEMLAKPVEIAATAAGQHDAWSCPRQVLAGAG